MSLIGLPQIYATLTPAQFTATAAQTTFTVPGGYTAPYIQVMRNGAMLGSGDFTATNGTTVVLNSACSAGDQVVIWAFGAFNVASPQFSDAGFLIYDNADATKKVTFEASGITTGTTRTITVPDASGTMGVVTAETAWTPTPANLTGTGITYNCKYTRLGNLIFVTIEVIGTGLAATANSTTLTLPSAPSQIGACSFVNVSDVSLGVGIFYTDSKVYLPTISSTTRFVGSGFYYA